jgi:hypothetical protein
LRFLLFLLPWASDDLVDRAFQKNQPAATALGVGVGIASIIGVVLLLVAACFGLLSNANFH